MNMKEIKDGIKPHAADEKFLIGTILGIQNGHGKSNISHGSMASQKAESVCHTGIDFLNAYFQHMGEEDLLEKSQSALQHD